MLFFSFLRRAAASEWPGELPVIPQTPPPLLPPPHLLTSLRFHLGQRAGLHTSPLPSPVTLQQETKEGRKGDIPTRSSSSPRDFTLGYVCMLSPPRRVFYVRPSILRASFLPSFLPTMCSEGIFIQPAVRRGRVEVDPLPSRSAIFNRPPPSSVGPQRRAAALRGGRG